MKSNTSSASVSFSLHNRYVIVGLSIAATTVLGILFGYLAVVAPLYALLLAAIPLALALLLALDRNLPSFFLRSLAGLLVGYAFFGRGLAYVGAPPIYIGEILLGLGCLSLILTFRNDRMGILSWFLVIFIGLGVIRTLPYLSRYGTDSLRDGALWGYAIFALALSFALSPSDFSRITQLYRRFIPLFLIWVPIAGIIDNLWPTLVPEPPGSSISFLVFKGGDMGVHLGGVAAFIILGLYSSRPITRFHEFLLWITWIAGLALVSLNRAGLAVATLCVLAAGVLWPSRRIVPLLAVIVAILFMASLLKLEFDPKAGGRKISVQEVGARLSSVFLSDEDSTLSGTKEWRIRWWQDVWDYTVNGPNFWTGKGFGVNLADDDGFQVPDQSLRAPHNSHVTILARMGVPGLALWIVLQSTFALNLALAAHRAVRRGDIFWAQLDAWLLLYWLGAMINTSFDPYLEGPQGAIWFWSLFGVGLAALNAQRRLHNPMVIKPWKGWSQREHAPVAVNSPATGNS